MKGIFRPSIRRKAGLDRLSAMGEIDGLILNLIDFYVSAPTPELHQSNATLQFSENITFFVICRRDTSRQQRGLSGPVGFAGYRLGTNYTE
jgi:hypothetical protein